MLKVGDRAPDTVGIDHQGNEVRLATLLGAGPVVVYFYPKDFTPGCTIETCGFRDAYAEFVKLGAQVVGVSTDDVESHRRFADHYGVPFSLLSDVDKGVVKTWDVQGFFGLFAKRVTYVVGPDHIVRGVFHHELNIKRHIKDVRELLVEMHGQAGSDQAR